MDNPYTYFDKIYCITLEHRKDRQQSSEKIFCNFNIPVEFFYTKKHPQGGIIGCFLSHITCIQNAYDSGANTILIFEDDVIPTKGYDTEIITQCIEFMKNNEWEYFQFGYIINNIGDFFFAEQVNNNIIKYNGTATHAYCLSRVGIKRILKNAYNIIQQSNIIPIDYYYLEIFPKKTRFCVIPLQFDQKWCIEHDNIPNSFKNLIYRLNQCTFEKYNIWHNISILYYYRIYLLILIIFFVVIIFNICKQRIT
jgi:GR25 family glycosyltransferase involved in LPS biosynthesis